MLWRELVIEDIEDGSKAQLKKLSGLKKTVKKTGLYIDVSKNIKNFINTIPLIAALRSPSMRPRHWELLRKATGKEFVPPHEDEDLQLGGLLSLNLHEFNTDVEEICDQATKEEKIEVRSRRPVVQRRCYAIDARRLQERSRWVVSLSNSRPFVTRSFRAGEPRCSQ